MEIRDLTPADLDAAIDVRYRSFGPLSTSSVTRWKAMSTRAIDERRMLAAYDAGTVIAVARINRFRQWWAGRSLPMAGIGGVVVAPEHRGRGVATALMTAILERSRELGFAVSALYPAAAAPYHAVGYELSGRRWIVEVDAEAVRRLGRPQADIRRATPGDEGHLVELTGGLSRTHRDVGPFDYEPAEWCEELEDDEFFGYFTEDGFVGYGFEGSDVLHIATIAGGSEATLRSLWGIVGSGSSIAKTIRASIGPNDPLRWIVGGGVMRVQEEQWWMLRLVDATAAVEGRGFPNGLTVQAPLRLRDELLPGNAGSFTLRVAGGRGNLVSQDSTPDALVLDPRGMAALFAGTPTATLRLSGLASGGSDTGDLALDAAFAANAFMTDYF